MNQMRLIVDPPASGSWNMAVDEAILRSAGDLGMPTLRFYLWSEPTLSLGYFQRYEERWQHAASRDCVCVRRASGGGAILHDQELTYSFIAPVADSRASHVTAWFDVFHESLISVLQGWGIEARLSGNPPPKGAPEPFLCFQRRHEVDVVVNGYKVCGSAQRRHQVAILQHGSVLLQRSTAAPELPGLENLSSQEISPPALIQAWGERLKMNFSTSYVDSPLTEQEIALANQIEQDKFAAAAWTQKR